MRILRFIHRLRAKAEGENPCATILMYERASSLIEVAIPCTGMTSFAKYWYQYKILCSSNLARIPILGRQEGMACVQLSEGNQHSIIQNQVTMETDTLHKRQKLLLYQKKFWEASCIMHRLGCFLWMSCDTLLNLEFSLGSSILTDLHLSWSDNECMLLYMISPAIGQTFEQIT